MALKNYKTIFLVVTAVLALFVASPAIQQFAVFPQTSQVTELSIFGQYNNASYPFNVTSAQSYKLNLIVSNHLGSCAYYMIEPKFRNETQPAPSSFNGTSSSQPSLGDIYMCVADNEAVQLPINVSLVYSYNKTAAEVDVQDVVINGFPLSAGSTTAAWDTTNAGYYGNLFFELYLFNDTTSSFQYNQRYVSLWLNMTV